MIRVPGGNAGQVLAKASTGDFDVEWVDQASGSGPTAAYLASNVTIVDPAGTGYSTMTGMSVAYEAGVYRVQALVIANTSNAVVDPRFRFVATDGTFRCSTDLDSNVAGIITTGPITMGFGNTNLGSSSVLGTLVSSNGGTLTIEWGANATGTATLTAYAGTHLLLTRLGDA